MTRDQWLAAFARDAGVERPSPREIRDLLDLAGRAAHGSERTAAPLACWMAAASKRPLSQLLAAAERIGDDAGSAETPAGSVETP